MQFSVLLIGDLEQSEFVGVGASLERWGDVKSVATADAAIELLTQGDVLPDWIVVAQAFPGQVSREALERCRRHAPLARIVGVLGSWCEGEMRTGTPWPATARCYWHQWPSKATSEFSAAVEGRLASWTLPSTATDEERVLAELPPPDVNAAGLVVIQAKSATMAEWLAATLHRAGYATIWQQDSGDSADARSGFRVLGATAVLFDATDFGPAEEQALERCMRRHAGVPAFVLMSFPRPHDQQRVAKIGATLLSKPVSLDVLLAALAATHR